MEREAREMRHQGFAYKIDEAGARITGFRNDSGGLDVVIPDTIAGAPVIAVEGWAFDWYAGVKRVVIPSSVRVIGRAVFFGCRNLVEITVDPGNHAYASVDGVLFDKQQGRLIACPGDKAGMYGIPDSVRTIGEGAFSGCRNLTGVVIPSSVRVIEGSAFSGCRNLREVIIPPSVRVMGEWLFRGCASLERVVLPLSARVIAAWMFRGCTRLEWIVSRESVKIKPAFFGPKPLVGAVIPPVVRVIGECAFSGCKGVKRAVIPHSVTSIGDEAFFGCKGMEDVVIPEGVRAVGKRAFGKCARLREAAIPASVTAIGPGVFHGCTRLTGITVDEGNKAYASVDGVLFDKQRGRLVACPEGKAGMYGIPDSVRSIEGYAFWGCDRLTGVVIPASVTHIGNGAFCGCAGLARVVIPESMSAVGDLAFYARVLAGIAVDEGNGSYASVDGVLFDKQQGRLIACPGGKAGIYGIPDSVRIIGEGAFARCRRLTGVVIPPWARSIEDLAFWECDRLTGVVIPASVTHIGKYAFSGCRRLAVITLSRRTRAGPGAFPRKARIEYRD